IPQWTRLGCDFLSPTLYNPGSPVALTCFSKDDEGVLGVSCLPDFGSLNRAEDETYLEDGR
ncbi:MAG TPA: hypothetical protein DHV85_10775, partial [Candidatus Accumulibacter sp.]|nr:hypothetical protein [Accumulibacter sp.]